MSLRQIASELGISPAYLSYMVNGQRPWRPDLYERYCRLVNTCVNSPSQIVNQVDGVELAAEQGFGNGDSQLGVSFGGSGRESNPPTPCLTRHNGFEVRKSHRAPSTPGPGTRQTLGCANPAPSQSSF